MVVAVTCDISSLVFVRYINNVVWMFCIVFEAQSRAAAVSSWMCFSA